MELYEGNVQPAGGAHNAEKLSMHVKVVENTVKYNDKVRFLDKIRKNSCRHYSFEKDIEMIIATVLGRKIKYVGEEI